MQYGQRDNATAPDSQGGVNAMRPPDLAERGAHCVVWIIVVVVGYQPMNF